MLRGIGPFLLALFLVIAPVKAEVLDNPFDRWQNCEFPVTAAPAFGWLNDVKKHLERRWPQANFYEFDEELTQDLLDAINAIPPVTTLVADEIYIAEMPGEPMRYVHLIKEDCSYFVMPADAKSWTGLMRTIGKETEDE